MPTNYPGSPNATQAPSAPPTPGAVPTAVLPADGDPPNAAAFAQAYKVLADFCAWLMSPRAKLSDWAHEIMSWKTTLLHRRAYVSHQGFLEGNVQTWSELWDKTSAATFGTDQPWQIPTLVPAVVPSIIGLAEPTLIPSSPLFRACALTPDTASATLAYVKRNFGHCVPDADLSFNVTFVVTLLAVGSNRTTFFAGLVNKTGIPDAFSFGATFIKDESVTNWFAQVDGVTRVDTGVAPVAHTYQRLRIEYVGAFVSDDGAARTLFYIDDVLVANISHAITPTNGDELVAMIGGRTSTTGGAPVTGYYGPIHYHQNTFRTA